jgi:phosphoribosylpyrophosphate synthetase
MTLSLLSGSAHTRLAQEIGEILGVKPTVCEVERFPDGELQVKWVPCMTGMCTSSSRPGLR